jgi:TrmH family RNA methyltransferase
MKVTKAQLRDLVALHRRSGRDARRAFLVEGAQAIAEALREDPVRLEALYAADPDHPLTTRARDAGVPVAALGADGVRRLATTVTPQPLVGVAPYLDVAVDQLPVHGCLAICHRVRDPGNAGTILRSCDAAGASGVVFTTESVDVYNPKTVRSSAGSIFHLPVARDAEVADAVRVVRERGVRVLAMAAAGGQSLYATDLTGPVALLFGNEAHGLDAADLAMADAVVTVPHPGRAESLNLAAAATVCVFEWARRRAIEPSSLETVIASAAHDIRSPLTAMLGFGHLLERRWPELGDDERVLMISAIVHDAERMEQVVRLLVDAARVAGGAIDTFPEPVDLGDLVAAIGEGLRRDPEHPPVTFGGDRGPFLVDPVRLRTSLQAGIEALVWWGSEGPVVVTAIRSDAWLEVRLTRTADPPPGDLEGLFVVRSPGSGHGSKMGLFVARGVARAQGGDAWASTDGSRLTVHLRLPVPG